MERLHAEELIARIDIDITDGTGFPAAAGVELVQQSAACGLEGQLFLIGKKTVRICRFERERNFVFDASATFQPVGSISTRAPLIWKN